MPTADLSAPCGFLGERIYPPLVPDTRLWGHCLHPRRPLGLLVCPCRGCGPKCPGYDADAHVEQPPPVNTGKAPLVYSPPERSGTPMRWSYGVTSCAERLHTLLPRTLASLAAAGFDRPWVFLDGVEPGSWRPPDGVNAVYRYPRLRTLGNWALSMGEVYLRDPFAERFALFQDDVLLTGNLRAYLNRCRLDEHTYWNLYTSVVNHRLAPRDRTGWYRSDQLGKGALGLVFTRKGVTDCLSSIHFIGRPINAHRGHRNVDGGVSHALCAKMGYTELCHAPTLAFHTGRQTTMGSKEYPDPIGWAGEDADAVKLYAG